MTSRAQRSAGFEYWSCLVWGFVCGCLFGVSAGAPFVAAAFVILALEKRP